MRIVGCLLIGSELALVLAAGLLPDGVAYPTSPLADWVGLVAGVVFLLASAVAGVWLVVSA